MPVCPKDKDLNYVIKYCKEFVKSNIRPWCKDCVHMKDDKKKGKK